jgi:hypothetical protein
VGRLQNGGDEEQGGDLVWSKTGYKWFPKEWGQETNDGENNKLMN